MIGELDNHLVTNWYSSLSSFKSNFKHFGVSNYTRRVTLAKHRWAQRNAPCLYELFLHPILYVELYLYNGVLVSVYCDHARGPKFDPGQYQLYLMLTRINLEIRIISILYRVTLLIEQTMVIIVVYNNWHVKFCLE